ncbi:MAG: type II secretion system protein [Planctomycetota bacterium]|jgi:prepilin-type N-terminal cleavage/methylation domain-containing protein/prepilin-type processing-associated H-X9-DG protein
MERINIVDFKRRAAFTLIELLVVISIIALLMAMLMPALGRAKAMAIEVACQSNLKQCGTMLAMFANDHNGYFSKGHDPGGPDGEGFNGSMTGAVSDYWKIQPKICYCPMAIKRVDQGGQIPFAAHESGSYAFNDWIHNPGSTYHNRPYAKVPQREKYWRTPFVKGTHMAPMYSDGWRPRGVPNYTDSPPLFEFDHVGIGASDSDIKNFCVNRHNGYVNICFLDFSVRKTGIKELWYQHWHKKWDEYTAEYPPFKD